MKKISLRTCLGCGAKRHKRELIRVVRNLRGEVALDLGGRANGRGSYLCPNLDCFKKGRKRLSQALKTSIDEATLKELESYFVSLGSEEEVRSG